jgi:serine/threonine-protein kinase
VRAYAAFLDLMASDPQKRGASDEHPVTGGSTGVIRDNASGARSYKPPPPPPGRASKVDLATASPLGVGAVVAGRYKIERVIGVGGMGAVYEATQLNIGRRVALKVVRADYAGDPMMAKRFQREATAAATVHHPNVVVVHEFGQADDGTLFLVMELLDGESLSARMKRSGKIAPRDAVRITNEVLGALAAAHDAGVVHRDLKPDNVMLLSSGGVKVLDFGIARLVDRGETPAPSSLDRSALTEVGQMLGTPRYMSPEAVARMPVGPAADLYAMGAILFEMLAGRPVFTEKEPVILMGHHLRTEPPRLRDTAPDIEAPYALDEIIDHMLRKMPTDRPASAESVRKKLLALDWSRTMGEDHNRNQLFTKPPDEEVPRDQFIKGQGPLTHAMRTVVVLMIGATIAWILYVHRQRLEEERRLRQQQIHAVVTPVETQHAPTVHQAHMTIHVLPEAAAGRVRWDGVEMASTDFDVTQDGAPHHLEIVADGYVSQAVELSADGPHELTITLARASGRGTKRTPRSTSP